MVGHLLKNFLKKWYARIVEGLPLLYKNGQDAKQGNRIMTALRLSRFRTKNNLI